MTHGKKNRSKYRKIRIATCIIIIIIVLFIVCLKILLKKDSYNTENSENEFVLYNSSIADYVKESEDGTALEAVRIRFYHHAPGHRPGTLRRYSEDGRGLHQRQRRQYRHLSDADPDAPGGDCRSGPQEQGSAGKIRGRTSW